VAVVRGERVPSGSGSNYYVVPSAANGESESESFCVETIHIPSAEVAGRRAEVN